MNLLEDIFAILIPRNKRTCLVEEYQDDFYMFVTVKL